MRRSRSLAGWRCCGLARSRAVVSFVVNEHQQDPQPYIGAVRARAGRHPLARGLLRRRPERGPRPDVLRQVHRHGEDVRPALGEPVHQQERGLAARPQLRDREDQGQRHRRQPDRDRRRRRLARASTPRRPSFDVENYHEYVQIQAEAAVRNLAMHHPYDATTTPSCQPARPIASGRRAARRRRSNERVHARRRRGRRRAHRPPRVRARDRAGDAAAPAGRRHHRGAHADRRRRGLDGRDGARSALEARHRRARRRAQGRDGLQPARRAVRRARRPSRWSTPARCTRRARWPSASRSCCGSIRRCSTPSRSGRPTTCARSTRRSSTCCATRWPRPRVLKLGQKEKDRTGSAAHRSPADADLDRHERLHVAPAATIQLVGFANTATPAVTTRSASMPRRAARATGPAAAASGPATEPRSTLSGSPK